MTTIHKSILSIYYYKENENFVSESIWFVGLAAVITALALNELACKSSTTDGVYSSIYRSMLNFFI